MSVFLNSGNVMEKADQPKHVMGRLGHHSWMEQEAQREIWQTLIPGAAS